MSKAVLETGGLAVKKQKGVVNIGKKAERLTGDNDITIADRQAKTIVDEEVQELLLKAALKVLDGKRVKLDAEEETPSTKLFSNKSSAVTLVIDPIDGTREYIDGLDSYSINIGLVEKGRVISAFVYFPIQKNLYFLGSDGRPYLSKNGNVKNAKPLKARPRKNKNVYVNVRVSEEINHRLEKAGYKVIWRTSVYLWSKGILLTLSDIKVVLFHTPQIRDILLGAIIAAAPNGYGVDWKGQKLVWPDGGRVHRAMFGTGQPSKEILDCLKEP